MLRRLLIRDYVLVDSLEMEFGTGFGAVTGETGAGKSILVDALALALGGRADGSAVRAGREKAEISAEFQLPEGSAVREWLTGSDLEAEDGVCLLRRVIEAGGRSRGYINGAPVTAGQLREVGDLLVDIHGQNAHHALLHPETQRALVDAHAGLSDTAREVGRQFHAWQQARAARAAAEANAAARGREREALEHQLAELAGLAFDPGEWQRTLEEHGRQAHASELIAGAQELLAILEDSDAAALLALQHGAVRAHALSETDRGLAEVSALLEAAVASAGEAARALRRYVDRMEVDPARLAELDQRIDAVTRVTRKHHVSPEDLPELARELQARLDALAAAGDPERLQQAERAAAEGYTKTARGLSEGRRSAAESLSREVTRVMADLAMKGGAFEVTLVPVREPASYGLETVEFRVSAHPGQPRMPLSRVASGGELSRMGLAVQVIASTAGRAPTLVFDEVDVGIGGAVAEIVGRLLRRVGETHQVLCVTHLPQVAAQAHWQWSVSKEMRAGSAVSRISRLETDDRIEEIARMLGGVEITEATRRHALEMLGAAGSSVAGG